MSQTALANMLINIGANSSQLVSEMNKTNRKLDNFGKKAQRIGGMIGLAFGADQVIQFGRAALEASAKAEGIATAFSKIQSSGIILKDLERATRGTVDQMTLMQKALQAQNLGLSVGQLSTFFEFATKRAIETGESVDYLVDSIVTGIGRKSVMIMDNLGISAARLRETMRDLNLSFGEASAVVINEELEKMGNVADTSATKLARLKAQLDNLQSDAGDAGFTFLGAIDDLVNAPRRLAMFDAVMKAEKARPDLFSTDGTPGVTMGGINAPPIPGVSPKSVETLEEFAKRSQKALNLITAELEKQKILTQDVTIYSGDLSAEYERLGEIANNRLSAEERLNKEIEWATSQYPMYEEEASNLAPTLEDLTKKQLNQAAAINAAALASVSLIQFAFDSANAFEAMGKSISALLPLLQALITSQIILKSLSPGGQAALVAGVGVAAAVLSQFGRQREEQSRIRGNDLVFAQSRAGSSGTTTNF